MKRIVIDLDHTMCSAEGQPYRDAIPHEDVIQRLWEYRNQGFSIIIYTSRNMRTYDGRIGKINMYTLPVILEWLQKHEVPHDEVIVGKPWCGEEGFYVDDRAIRPSEFISLSYEEVKGILGLEQ